MYYLAALITVAIWGATPAATAIAVADIDAVTVGMLRTVIPALLLGPAALLLRLPLPRGAAGGLALATATAAGFIGFSLLFTIGIRLTSTAHAALILAAAPLFTGMLGFALERSWPGVLWWLGAAVAMTGEVVLIGHRAADTDATATLAGDLVVLASVLVVSAGYVAGARVSRQIGSWSATAWGIGFAGLALVPALLWRATDVAPALAAAAAPAWSAVAYLALFSSILAYASWYWAIDGAGVKRIAPIQFLQPVVSLALAVVLLGEPLTATVLIALAAILAGVAMASMTR